MQSKATTKLKDHGDNLFKAGKLQQALLTYRKAIRKEALRATNQGDTPEEEENHFLSQLWDSMGQTHMRLYRMGHKLQPDEPIEVGDKLGQKGKEDNGLYLALRAFNKAMKTCAPCAAIHNRRSQVFQWIKEELKVTQEGMNPIQESKDRASAQVIVDIRQTVVKKKKRGKIICNNLTDGIKECKEGQIIFIEKGVYCIPQTTKITKGISIIGASGQVVVGCNKRSTQEAAMAAWIIDARDKEVFLKNLKLKIPIYILNCENIEISHCIVEGDKYVTLVKLEPGKIANIGIKRETGPEPCRININNCMFLDCESKNPILMAGAKTKVTLSNCLVEKCRAILIHGQAHMEIRDCELKEGTGNMTAGFLAMATKEAVLEIVTTTITTGWFLSGVAISYQARGSMIKSLCTAPSIPARQIFCFILVDQAAATIMKSRFMNLGALVGNYQHPAIIINRHSSKATKITKNKFRNCANGISINNGARPTVSHNSFAGWTKEHICIEGGANPKIKNNIFEMKTSHLYAPLGFIPRGITYRGNSSGLLARNRFMDGEISVLIADTSQPTMKGNVYESNQPDSILDEIITFLGDKIINNIAQETAAMNEYNQENKIPIQGKSTIRGCGGCSEYKECELCANCKSIYYCSKQCQTDNWERHAPKCEDIRHIKIDVQGDGITKTYSI